MKYSQVYIIDMGAYSGGGEALYQLGCDLVDMGYPVSIAYLDEKTHKPPKKINKYIEHGLDVIHVDHVKDCSDALLITPESCTDVLFRFKHINKMIWWLSYDWYDGTYTWDWNAPFVDMLCEGYKRNIVRTVSFISNIGRYGHYCYPLRDIINIAGSYYIQRNMLEKRHIASKLLIHSIGTDFLHAGLFSSKNGRADRVLYNPAKPSKLMKQLLRRNKFDYVPIQGLNFGQMIELFRTSKLYVDFGNFPGPERLPKETVFNGMNVLVHRFHAAATDDVLIPDKYKVDPKASPEYIESKIDEMLKMYEQQYQDFDAFRQTILGMESRYYSQLKQIF